MSKKTLDDWLNSLNQDKIDLGLARVKKVFNRLNFPKRQTITVAGTNGKGSTVAILNALLQEQKLKVGAFTSPHIFKYNERISINGEPASDDQIVAAFERIEEAKGDVPLSYFEYAFLVACCVFDAEKINVQVMEVGLGGRLDAVNVLDADAAIITGIAIDHVDWLGDDLEVIGKEKAGILRSGQVAAFGAQNVPNSVTEYASDIGCDLQMAGQDYHFNNHEKTFDYQDGSRQFRALKHPVLSGDWQIQNAAAAINVVLRLGYCLKPEYIDRAMAGIKLSGRLETISHEPLVIADVAHNAQSAAALAQWLGQNPVKGQTRAVFSVLNDKQPETWLSQFDDVVDHWFVFELGGERAMPLNDLKRVLADHVGLFSCFAAAKQAYQMATIMTDDGDRVVVFGSFHVLDEVLNNQINDTNNIAAIKVKKGALDD